MALREVRTDWAPSLAIVNLQPLDQPLDFSRSPDPRHRAALRLASSARKTAVEIQPAYEELR